MLKRSAALQDASNDCIKSFRCGRAGVETRLPQRDWDGDLQTFSREQRRARHLISIGQFAPCLGRPPYEYPVPLSPTRSAPMEMSKGTGEGRHSKWLHSRQTRSFQTTLMVQDRIFNIQASNILKDITKLNHDNFGRAPPLTKSGVIPQGVRQFTVPSLQRDRKDRDFKSQLLSS